MLIIWQIQVAVPNQWTLQVEDAKTQRNGRVILTKLASLKFKFLMSATSWHQLSSPVSNLPLSLPLSVAYITESSLTNQREDALGTKLRSDYVLIVIVLAVLAISLVSGVISMFSPNKYYSDLNLGLDQPSSSFHHWTNPLIVSFQIIIVLVFSLQVFKKSNYSF